jgi:hypothetical protein
LVAARADAGRFFVDPAPSASTAPCEVDAALVGETVTVR